MDSDQAPDNQPNAPKDENNQTKTSDNQTSSDETESLGETLANPLVLGILALFIVLGALAGWGMNNPEMQKVLNGEKPVLAMLGLSNPALESAFYDLCMSEIYPDIPPACECVAEKGVRSTKKELADLGSAPTPETLRTALGRKLDLYDRFYLEAQAPCMVEQVKYQCRDADDSKPGNNCPCLIKSVAEHVPTLVRSLEGVKIFTGWDEFTAKAVIRRLDFGEQVNVSCSALYR